MLLFCFHHDQINKLFIKRIIFNNLWSDCSDLPVTRSFKYFLLLVIPGRGQFHIDGVGVVLWRLCWAPLSVGSCPARPGFSSGPLLAALRSCRVPGATRGFQFVCLGWVCVLAWVWFGMRLCVVSVSLAVGFLVDSRVWSGGAGGAFMYVLAVWIMDGLALSEESLSLLLSPPIECPIM